MARTALLATAAGLALLGLAGLPGRPRPLDAAVATARAATVATVAPERLPLEPRDDGRACKPRGPVQLELRQVASGAGGARSLVFQLSPREELAELSWSLRLPGGAELLSGDGQGPADPGAHARTSGRLSLRLPADEPFAQVVLEARGRWGAAGEEQVVVRRALTWGELAAPVPEVEQLDTTHGSSRRFAELPTSHEPGR